MRTIGILGGIGPQATMEFEARVHRVSQRLIPQTYNEGYPPLVTVYMRHAPVVVERGRPTEPLTLDPRILEVASKLGQWADLIVVIANTPHFFIDAIRDAAGCELISMVEVTLDELKRREISHVGLLGLGVPKVYAERFEEEGLQVSTAAAGMRDRLDGAILRLMEGAAEEGHRVLAREAVDQLRGTPGVQATVLGCTEIPLLLGSYAEAPDLVDPTGLLAEAVVRRAIE
jgi:aspartate racemase